MVMGVGVGVDFFIVIRDLGFLVMDIVWFEDGVLCLFMDVVLVECVLIELLLVVCFLDFNLCLLIVLFVMSWRVKFVSDVEFLWLDG